MPTKATTSLNMYRQHYNITNVVKPHMQAMSNKQQLKVQVTGVLTHGHGAYVYLQYGQFPCDSNLTTTVLVKCLEQVSPLPEVLYIQMDNCTGQNKNKYVLALLAHLVKEEIFRKVGVQMKVTAQHYENQFSDQIIISTSWSHPRGCGPDVLTFFKVYTLLSDYLII